MVAQEAGLRVGVRFRPVNNVEAEEDGNHVCVQIAQGRACRINRGDMPSADFCFDAVYKPGVTQKEVYEHTGRPLVDQVMAGFNSTIFAYGQTGSGKTYSMLGVVGDDENEGMIPRICRDIFAEISADKSGDTYECYVSLLQIYLGRVDDLLDTSKKSLAVRENRGRNYADKATRQKCFTASDILMAIDMGSANRAVSAHRMNEASSRSHMVIVLDVIRHKKDGGKVMSSCKMVDLAGSEKVGKTMASGQRLLEAKKINGSLSQLGMVMEALTSGKDYVPYRGSALTMLLKDSLGGNSKTSLLVATSPCSYNVEETMSTLRFAALAKKVRNRVKIAEVKTIAQYQRSEEKLTKHVERLMAKLKISDCVRDAFEVFIRDENGQVQVDKLLASIKMMAGQAEEQLDFDALDWQTGSSQVLVRDKVTGKIITGKAFSASAGMEEAKEGKRAEVSIQDFAAGAADTPRGNAACKSGNGYNCDVMLQMQEYRDEIADLQCYLAGANSQISSLHDELDDIRGEAQRASMAAQKFEQEIGEARFYKQKCEWLEGNMMRELDLLARENAAMRKILDADIENEMCSDTQSALSGETELEDSPVVGAKAMIEIAKLHRAIKRKNKLIRSFTQFQKMDDQHVRKFDTMNATQQRALLRQALANESAAKLKVQKAQAKVHTCVEYVHRAKAAKEVFKTQRQQFNEKMAQMQQAVFMAAKVAEREQLAKKNKVAFLGQRVEKLVAYIARLNATGGPSAKPALASDSISEAASTVASVSSSTVPRRRRRRKAVPKIEECKLEDLPEIPEKKLTLTAAKFPAAPGAKSKAKRSKRAQRMKRRVSMHKRSALASPTSQVA